MVTTVFDGISSFSIVNHGLYNDLIMVFDG